MELVAEFPQNPLFVRELAKLDASHDASPSAPSRPRARRVGTPRVAKAAHRRRKTWGTPAMTAPVLWWLP